MKKAPLFVTISVFLLIGQIFNQVLAQDASAAKSQDGMSPFIGLILMLAVFFFLIILPQSRKAKKQAQFIASLQKGDAVVTQSGLYGKIYNLADRVATLEIAPNVRIRVDRQSIASKDTSDASKGEASKTESKETAA